ncbi:unnamed protein product, partial [Mesorhabditis spiculigera]
MFTIKCGHEAWESTSTSNHLLDPLLAPISKASTNMYSGKYSTSTLFFIFALFGSTTALNCTSSLGPCFANVSCVGVSTTQGTVCTANGCCAGANLIDGTATSFTCSGGAIGPCNAGACPASTDTACVGTQIDGVGQCCPGSGIVAVTTTTSTTTATTTYCVDLLNPVTGVSDCPKRAYLCADSTYYSVMAVQCRKTCGFCATTSSSSTTCVDQVNAYTGVSDCSSLSYLCSSPTYATLMATQCCATCSSYGK